MAWSGGSRSARAFSFPTIRVLPRPAGRGGNWSRRMWSYSILRIADVKVGSGGYWVFRGKIAGLDEFREASRGEAPTDYDREVEGLRVVGRMSWRSA